jgi:hypothetical protein
VAAVVGQLLIEGDAWKMSELFERLRVSNRGVLFSDQAPDGKRSGTLTGQPPLQ